MNNPRKIKKSYKQAEFKFIIELRTLLHKIPFTLPLETVAAEWPSSAFADDDWFLEISELDIELECSFEFWPFWMGEVVSFLISEIEFEAFEGEISFGEGSKQIS